MRSLLKRFSHVGLALLLTASMVITQAATAPKKAEALANSDFTAARIIDDSVFFNPNSMSSQDIQNFLNSKVPTCETNHAQGGYPYPPPYICLKEYTTVTDAMPADAFCGAIPGGSKSAATIIKEVSAACSVSPQIMLIVLQKEQVLVTDTWPLPSQYTKATGYGCPDSVLGTDVDANRNGCYDEYEGFFKQMYYGARQYQKYAKQPNMFNFRAGQNAYVQYNPNTGCGGSSFVIQNQATAGLYNYTPYQPNAAVLGSAHGVEVTCGAYGNINFWWQYWQWFGNPIGSPYAWLIDNFYFSGGDNVLTKGYAETLTLKAKNVGRNPWYRGGDNPVRLGTWQPADHPSPFLGGGNYRYATLQEAVVEPNAIGTFTFTITPGTAGTFVESMNLVVENSQWMSWPGFSPTIVVSATPYQYRVENIIYSSGGGVMEPGTTQDMTMIVRNTGNITWDKTSGPPIWLAPWNHNSEVGVNEPGKWPSNTRITQMNESSVAPGQTAGFQFKVQVPRAGNFYEQLNLVAEGHSWFGGDIPTLYLRGASYGWQPVWTSLSTGNVNIGRNQTFDVTIRAKNTGEITWRRSGPPIRLATVRPQNRGSSLYYTNWINDTRPAILIENSVAPGQEGTFTFTARTPNRAGAINEPLSLIAEGAAWFNDPGVTVYINSL